MRRGILLFALMLNVGVAGVALQIDRPGPAVFHGLIALLLAMVDIASAIRSR